MQTTARNLILLALSIALAACSGPALHTAIGIGPGGVSIRPVATARIGGATLGVSP